MQNDILQLIKKVSDESLSLMHSDKPKKDTQNAREEMAKMMMSLIQAYQSSLSIEMYYTGIFNYNI